MYGASENVVREVRREEIRAYAEFSAYGEYIQKWREFKYALASIYEDMFASEQSRKKFVSVAEIVRILLKNEIISFDFFERAKSTQHFRNGFMHNRIHPTEQELRNEIAKLDELLDELGYNPF